MKKAQIQPTKEQRKLPELNTDMSLKEFTDELLRLNNLGRELTLKHKDLFGYDKTDKEGKGGRRYHVPATDAKCPHCNAIIKKHDDYMDLQAKQVGMTGIPFDALISAIKITRATILMMKNGGEL